MKKTYNQIIDETVEYYKKNPRGVDAFGNCKYVMQVGNKQCYCAVGRYLKNEHKVDGFGGDKRAAAIVSDELMVESVPSDIESIGFWEDLQTFHDSNLYWREDEHGQNLTRLGEDALIRLKKKYTNENLR